LEGHTGNNCFILGSTKRGKSTVLMHIYDHYYKGKEYCSIVWTMNPQIQLYRGHRGLIRGQWGETKKGEKFNNAETAIRIQHKIQVSTHNHYKFLNMLDDVVDLRGSAVLRNMVLTYRNSKMSSIVSLQYANSLPKALRGNLTNVLMFGFNDDSTTLVAIELYLTGYLNSIGIKKKADMISWYKNVTKDHGFIYLRAAEGLVSLHKLRV